LGKLSEPCCVHTDPRLEGYPMMASPWPTVFITLAYVYTVEVGLPRFMADRKPYNIRQIMLVYNFAMVILSGYIFMEFGLSGWFTGYSLGCQPVDYSQSVKSMVNICWWFYISKFIELLDTIFFLLRKKFTQVSFLHVVHHSVMPLSWYIGVKFVPGGFGTFHALLNSFIHFWMYIYYGMAALGPQYRKYLWWKKHMTTLQIVQFMMVACHCIRQLFVTNCNYPKGYAYWIGSYALFFLIMFADFYRQAYQNTKTNGAITNGFK
ncbi:Elongation of very long chain fatty acids protein, partial [Lamellibrachia satsuma]